METKLIVVADLGALKVYRVTREELARSPRIELIHEDQPAAAHERLQDRVTDRAGRFPGANGSNGGRMSAGENHNLLGENERRLIRDLAAQITAVVAREGVARWDFAAGRAINQRIVDEVADDVRAKLHTNVGSDLVKLGKAELLAQF